MIGWIAAALPALGFLVMVKIALGRNPSATAVPANVTQRVETAERGADTAAARVTWEPDVISAVASEAAPAPAEIADLLQTAGSARDAVLAEGRPLTRDTLAAQLRSDGYPMRNARVSMLLQALREDGEAGGAVELEDANAMIG